MADEASPTKNAVNESCLIMTFWGIDAFVSWWAGLSRLFRLSMSIALLVFAIILSLSGECPFSLWIIAGVFFIAELFIQDDFVE